MARETILTLDPTVSSARLRLAVARLLDAPMVPMVFSSDRDQEFDPTEPSGRSNPWHLDLKSEDRKRFFFHVPAANDNNRHFDLSHGRFSGEYLPGQCQNWSFHREGDHAHHQQWRGYTNALVIAVGIRLAHFFGGTLTYDDSKEEDVLRVTAKRAAFPPKKKGQTANERWHQFQNALAALAPLTAHEIDQAVAIDGRQDDRFVPFRDFLTAKAEARALDEAMPASERRQPRARM